MSEAVLDFTHVGKVAIIGAGVAGLQAASRLKIRGFDITIFEKSDDVGGVWRSNYADFGLQVPKDLYEFIDFPYPKSGDRAGRKYELFPSGPQVADYIGQYCDHKGLREHVRFNTCVLQLKPKAAQERGWRVEYGITQDDKNNSLYEEFDYVIIATGLYSWPPRVPQISGQEAFTGQILHSLDFTDHTQAKAKKVVVVGGGKSAVDNVCSAANVSYEPATLLFRSAHWPVPRYLCNLLPFKFGTYSRFGHFMLPTHCDESKVSWYIHSLLCPVKWVWWRSVELMIKLQFRLSGDMVPKTPIEIDLFTGGQIITYDLRNKIKAGKVLARKGEIDRFCEDGKGLVLKDGSHIPCDLLIYGTGYGKDYNLLDKDGLQSKLDIQKDGLYLYRNMIAPEVPDLAYIGSEVSTFNNILTQGLQAEWLAHHLCGECKLPSPDDMVKEIYRTQAWKRSWMPLIASRAAILQLHMMRYHDILCKDMGQKWRRKKNPLAEIFMPYRARDYLTLIKSHDEPS